MTLADARRSPSMSERMRRVPSKQRANYRDLQVLRGRMPGATQIAGLAFKAATLDRSVTPPSLS